MKRYKLLNNKGFSMIEILAVVVILGVVSTIGIVSVTRIVDASKKHFYDAQQDQMVLAAQAYAGDNRSILPRMIGQRTEIKLSKLYEKNYIKETIKDKNKGVCDGDKSFVSIYKSSQTDYNYTGHLNCPACEDSTGYCYEETTDSNPPEINVTFPPKEGNSGNKLYNATTNITIEMKANGKNAKIASYSYRIYVDKRLAFNSGTKRNGKVPTLTINEQLKKYLPGNIKVVVTVTNTDGSTRTVFKGENYEDAEFPACGKRTYDGNNTMPSYNQNSNVSCGTANYPWLNINSSNKTRHVWVNCDDEQGFGCAQQEFSKGLTTDGETENVVIKDAKGTSANCQVLKCIDTTTPALVVRILSGDTEKKKFTVSGQSTIKDYTKSETYDVWLNNAAYPNGVTIEVTVSDPASRPKSFKWYHNASGQKENAIGPINQKVFEDTSIELKELNTAGNYKKETTITNDGVRKEVFTVVDRAGNSITYSLILKIDRHAPPAPSVYMYREDNTSAVSTSTPYEEGKWKNKYVWVNSSSPTDSPNVSGWAYNQYSTTGAHGTYTNVTGKDVHISNEGASTITFKACDKANNCSDNATAKSIKLDRTAPSCSISGDGTWYTYGAYITTTCTKNDNYSSVTCPGNSPHFVTNDVTYYAKDEAENSSAGCPYKIQTATQIRRASCSLYKQSESKCSCSEYYGCRRTSFGKKTLTYSTSDEVCSNKSTCDAHINAGLNNWASTLTDATYGDFTQGYYRGKDPDGTVIGTTGVSGCTNIGTDVIVYHNNKKALILTNIDRYTCHESVVDSGNLWTDGRYYDSKCYLGVSNYYWSCNTGSRKKRLILYTYTWKKDAACGCKTAGRCEDAGCETWGAWGSWSTSNKSCNTNSCRSESRTIYK